MSYQEKLRHHYHELTHEEKHRYQEEDRASFSLEERFFFEGCLLIPGQMYLAERRALYNTILQYKPIHCLEIGTNMGGGSTFFLASAFARLGAGQVITLEKSKPEYEFARSAYPAFVPGLLPFVTFLMGDHPNRLLPYIESCGGVVECCLLDGGSSPEEALEQYEFFKPFLGTGSILMAHDWDTTRSPKMTLVKPIVMADPQWILALELGPPESVGFVVWQRR